MMLTFLYYRNGTIKHCSLTVFVQSVYIKIIASLHSFDHIITFIPKDMLFPKM